jgi:hypothetical protein
VGAAGGRQANLRVAVRLQPVLLPQRQSLVTKGTGPCFYLPKMESYLEARLWNDVFVFAQDYVGVPQVPSGPRCWWTM